jgi:hypothetical protein
MLDLGLLTNWQIWVLAGAGIAAGIGCAVAARRSSVHGEHGRREAWLVTAAVAIPLLAPLLVLGAAPAFAWTARVVHLPVHDAVYGFGINRDANEDYSAFGALGALAVLGVPILTIVAYRADRRQLALALALPSYLLLLGLYAKYNIWLTRFLIVPVVLTAPLFAHLVTRRVAAVAVLVVAGWTVFYALEKDVSKPLAGRVAGRPWQLDQAEALAQSPAGPTGRRAAAGLRAYDRLVPETACVGAVLDPDEWSYPLWGPKLRRRVLFLPSLNALETAYRDNVGYVVVSTGVNAPVAKQFTAAGWKLKPLAAYWNLVVAPGSKPGGSRPGGCRG